jgi:hypothetical protein
VKHHCSRASALGVDSHFIIFPAKAEKPMYSVLIYDEIRAMDPPGRFLKQDPSTKLWSDIGKKKALDKTRQALREGAPEILKEMGVGDDDSEEEGEVEKKQKVPRKAAKSKKKVEDHPLDSSFMSNISIGSFSIDGLNDSMFDLNTSSNQGQSQMGNWSAMMAGSSRGNMQNNGTLGNQGSLMSAQMQLLQQQMGQWQQIVNLQNSLQNSGNPNASTQLQLLNLQLQLQNQIGQQQNQIGQQQNHIGQQQSQIGQQQNQLGSQQQNNMFQANAFGNQHLQNQNQACLNSNISNNMNFSQTFSPPRNQVNDPNIAALLSAIHSNAASQNNVMQNQVAQAPQSMNPIMNMNMIQQFQNQLPAQQPNKQINNGNSNQGISIPNTNQQWRGGNIQNILADVGSTNNNNSDNNRTGQFGDFTLPLNDASNGDQLIGMTMPLQDNERKAGGTSLARSQ